jgi:hypothetical protein
MYIEVRNTGRITHVFQSPSSETRTGNNHFHYWNMHLRNMQPRHASVSQDSFSSIHISFSSFRLSSLSNAIDARFSEPCMVNMFMTVHHKLGFNDVHLCSVFREQAKEDTHSHSDTHVNSWVRAFFSRMAAKWFPLGTLQFQLVRTCEM